LVQHKARGRLYGEGKRRVRLNTLVLAMAEVSPAGEREVFD